MPGLLPTQELSLAKPTQDPLTDAVLRGWDAPFGMPPLGGFRDEGFAPAFAAALAEARAKGGAIAEASHFADAIEGAGRAEEAFGRANRPETIACEDFFVAPGGGQGVEEAGGMRFAGKARRVADGDAPRLPFDA